MNEKILTISIAAYNVEDYISQTLESLIDERIIDDLEIFVVDDGGKDKTLDIAGKYAEKYPNSVFPVHKENGGYGSTINTSVQKASGKYFKQLDGDDWYEKENLVKFVELLKKTDADMVASSSIKYYENEDRKEIQDCFEKIAEGGYKFNDLDFDGFFSMYAAAFKTEILKKIPMNITEHCFYTDVEYISIPIPYIESIYIWHEPIYIYRIGREGQSVSVEGIKKHYKEHEKVLWKLIDIYNALPDGAKTGKVCMNTRLIGEIGAHFLYLCYFPMSKQYYSELKEFYSKLKMQVPDILGQAVKQKRLVKMFALSNGLLYPLMRFFVKVSVKK